MYRLMDNFENGKKVCPLLTAAEIADILEVSVDYLLGRD